MEKEFNVFHLEDNPVFISIMKTLLRKIDLNIKYEFVHTSDEAFNYLSKKIPDLMFVDLMLEDEYNPEPGIKFIKEAYQLYNNLPMVVLTGNLDSGLKTTLHEFIVHYESKTFNPPIFKEKICNLLTKISK